MIDLRGLQFGNYLETLCINPEDRTLRWWESVRCDYDDIQEINFQGIEKAGFRAIELTEELLMKCGFTLNDNGTGCPHVEISVDEVHFAFDNEGGLDMSFFGCHISYPLYHIKYLHQLQNLYFTLIGEELELDL